MKKFFLFILISALYSNLFGLPNNSDNLESDKEKLIEKCENVTNYIVEGKKHLQNKDSSLFMQTKL